MGKLMERAAVNRSKRSGYRRNADPRQGIIKSAPPPKTKPDWILFGRPATYKNAAAQREPNAIFSPPFRRFDLSRPLIYRPAPLPCHSDFARIRPAFTTDTGVVSRGLTGDEGRGPCSIGGTINRTSYLARLSNFCLFRPENPLRGRGGGGEGLEDVAAKGFDNDF